MININKLKGKIVEKGFTISTFAQAIEMDKSTLYRKIAGGGGNISIAEADLIINALGLDLQEAEGIFLSQLVA